MEPRGKLQIQPNLGRKCLPTPVTAGYSLAPSRTGALPVAKAQATWAADPAI